MDKLSSRKNAHIVHLRRLAADGAYRRETGEFVLDGLKLLREAQENGAAVTSVLWGNGPAASVPADIPQFTAPPGLLAYASPLRESPGPVFTVRIPPVRLPERAGRVLVLENVQDPGNVGTAVRSAAAFGADAVLLLGDCADIYAPRAARATMGAVFRQCVCAASPETLTRLLADWALPLYGAALSRNARDLRKTDLTRAAVAVGNEGTGLSAALLDRCAGEVIVPMAPGSESLNAAMAATVILWEMARRSEI